MSKTSSTSDGRAEAAREKHAALLVAGWHALLHAAERPLPGPRRLPATRATPGVYAIGEALSRKQGWCEGALESALAIMDELSEAV